MRTGRPKVALMVTEDERRRLESLAHRSRSAPQIARRARIILTCADGTAGKVVARRLRVTPGTVCKWRGRFIAHRLDGLYDEPRPGAKRTITDAQVEQVIVRTLETTPRGATHWSTREMAKAVGLSHTAISHIWHTFGLQPHRTETFKLSNDPLLIDKVRDIVGLYLDPPAHAAVFCVDEKPQIQALDRTQPLLPMQPGQVERRTHDYIRHGTTTLFAALNAKTSEVITQFHQRHRSAQFRQFLDEEKIAAEDRVIRRIALRGAAREGMAVTRADLVPEVTITAEGVYWHPVGAEDADLLVTRDIFPLSEAFAAVRRAFDREGEHANKLARIFNCA